MRELMEEVLSFLTDLGVDTGEFLPRLRKVARALLFPGDILVGSLDLLLLLPIETRRSGLLPF